MRQEGQINDVADAVRSAYDPTHQRFVVVYSSGTTISSAVIFPDGRTGAVTTVLEGPVGEIPAGTMSTITEGGKRFRVRPYVVHHGREVSAVTAIGTAMEPRFRIAFWEWLSVAEERQEIIPVRPDGRVPLYPTTTRWRQTTRRLFTLELAQDGHAISEKRAHGPDFGAGAGALGTALSRDVRTDQLLISAALPTPSPFLQVELVP